MGTAAHMRGCVGGVWGVGGGHQSVPCNRTRNHPDKGRGGRGGWGGGWWGIIKGSNSSIVAQ